MYKNSTSAFYDCLQYLLQEGQKINIRDQEVKEVLSHQVGIERPWERVLVIPHRANNIFATIAETIWVIGGRNDLGFLLRYLPRAGEFSDDGAVWRAGYGKRMRHWHNQIDQIEQTISVLSKDPNSRRAVMIIFDPAEDYGESRDVPCNNWLHFIIRNNKLFMNIATRSNDILWGFSGINTFEWSVLHEMLAFWLGVEMGSAHYLIGSLHLYARHYERASRIISSRKEKTIYDFGFTPHKFQTPFVNLNDVLSSWFEIETQMRNATVDLEGEIRKINDNFLRNSLYMLNIYNQFLNGAEPEFIFHLIADLPVSDFRISAIEFFTRKFKSKDLTQFSDQEMYFFEYFWSPGEIS